MDHAETLLAHFTDLLRAISVSIVDDGHIDVSETRTIRAEWERLKAFTEAFVASCEEGAFAKVEDPDAEPPAEE
ncbi:MAG: hypothetical protein R3F62_27735 [Planctomycetota bacterium]